MHQYSDKIISPSHPVSKYVQKIAQRIVSSAGLGHVKGYSSSSTSFSSPFAIFGGTGGDDMFDPDTTKFSGTSGEKDQSVAINDEWEVYVIKDDETRNAFVLPGE